jgi:hypothetical protein
MADKPILFSGPMVRALLDGRKTQTRRVMRPQADHFMALSAFSDGKGIFRNDAHGLRQDVRALCSPGDRLWVKETWNVFALSRDLDDAWPLSSIPKIDPREDEDLRAPIVVDFPVAGLPGTDGGKGPWRPSIHMPRWASRLTLTVTDVRAERVANISYEDAKAEGLSWVSPTWGIPGLANSWAGSPRASFRALWDSLNAKRGFGWEANPWVWAYSFTVERRNIDCGQMTDGAE